MQLCQQHQPYRPKQQNRIMGEIYAPLVPTASRRTFCENRQKFSTSLFYLGIKNK